MVYERTICGKLLYRRCCIDRLYCVYTNPNSHTYSANSYTDTNADSSNSYANSDTHSSHTNTDTYADSSNTDPDADAHSPNPNTYTYADSSNANANSDTRSSNTNANSHAYTNTFIRRSQLENFAELRDVLAYKYR